MAKKHKYVVEELNDKRHFVAVLITDFDSVSSVVDKEKGACIGFIPRDAFQYARKGDIFHTNDYAFSVLGVDEEVNKIFVSRNSLTQ